MTAALLTCVAMHAGAAQRRAAPEKPQKAKKPTGESLCPAAIKVEQRASAVPEGWETAEASQSAPLAAVTFYDGPPAQQASLKYDREEPNKREFTATWDLPANSRGYWLECSYEHTAVVLSRRLKPEVTSCAVLYERKRGAVLPAVKHVGCK